MELLFHYIPIQCSFIVVLLTFDSVLLVEPLYSSGCVNQFFLTREERMASGADFNLDIAYRRTSLNYVSACACNLSWLVIWMYTLFHIYSSN